MQWASDDDEPHLINIILACQPRKIEINSSSIDHGQLHKWTLKEMPTTSFFLSLKRQAQIVNYEVHSKTPELTVWSF